MEKIEKYGKYCRSWEGGWSNHPNDKGGATMKGITYKTYCDYRKAKKLSKPTLTQLRRITAKEWNAVLRWGYWDRIKADKIQDEWVTYLIADSVWMSGIGYVKKVQQLLGLKADGIIGTQSLKAINSMDGKELFEMLWNQREKFLYSIATGGNASFLKGWLRRLNSMQYGCLTTNGGQHIR